MLALDARADRLPRLRANLARLGCAGFVEVRLGDARRLGAPPGPGYDRILLDVPCSNTGVIRRKPDVRWRFSAARLARLTAVQRQILTQAAQAVRPGGVLVYSTCSLEAEENERLIADWLDGRPEFRLEDAWKSVPPEGGLDGAYAARLVRE